MPETQKNTIVLIDDNPLLVDAYKQALTKEGFEVEIAYDGETGLELIEKKEPRIVLLDILLHGENGLSVLEQLKQREFDHVMDVIILTMDEAPETEERAKELGVALFLKKHDCSINTLIQEVRTIIDKGEHTKKEATGLQK